MVNETEASQMDTMVNTITKYSVHESSVVCFVSTTNKK